MGDTPDEMFARRQSDGKSEGPWWDSAAGLAVRWSIFGALFLFVLLWLVGGSIHARRRMRRGLPPLAYHWFLLPRKKRDEFDSGRRHSCFGEPPVYTPFSLQHEAYALHSPAEPLPAYTRDGPPSYQHLDVVLKDYAIDVPAEAPVLPALPRNHHLSIPIPLLQRRSHLFRQSIVPPHHPVTVERSHQEQGPAHGPPEPEQPFERSRQQREGVVEDSEQQQQQQQQQQQNEGRQCRVDGLEEQQQESQEQRVSEELLHKTVEEDSPAKNEEPTPATKDEPDPCAGSTKEPAGPSTSIG